MLITHPAVYLLISAICFFVLLAVLSHYIRDDLNRKNTLGVMIFDALATFAIFLSFAFMIWGVMMFVISLGPGSEFATWVAQFVDNLF